jgi:S1-C subfamily serine protease
MKVVTLILIGLLALTACAPNRSEPPAAAVPVTREGITLVDTRQQAAQPTAVPQEIITQADAEYLLLTNLYERLAPSVVNIEVTVATPNDAAHAGLPDGEASGSGFVYDLNGHIITNAHVVNDSTSIRVTFEDGSNTEAQLIGVDIFSDLAVIQVEVDASRLSPVTMADSDLIRVGERAIAIGNPFGLASSMTVGIISGLGRQLPSAELVTNTITPGFQNPSIIQVDTDINPGNSGGPLLNSRGEVIGVNTAIRTESGVFSGVGFAVPSNTARRVVPELIANGRVEYAWLGITSMASEEGLGVAGLADTLELPVRQGVLIDTVVAESPAAKAGLQGGNIAREVRGQTVCTGGDIIVAVNDEYIRDMDALLAYIVQNASPGDTLRLLVLRGTETFELPLLLEPRPTEAARTTTARCG